LINPTKFEIRKWFEYGENDINTHMFRVCDDSNSEEYPIYISKSENVRERYDQIHNVNMQIVMSVYTYLLPIEWQLGEDKCFNF
jgi:hypothetical protein